MNNPIIEQRSQEIIRLLKEWKTPWDDIKKGGMTLIEICRITKFSEGEVAAVLVNLCERTPPILIRVMNDAKPGVDPYYRYYLNITATIKKEKS